MSSKKKGDDDSDTTTSWECSYVMSNGDGVNLFGKLDVDPNRARFVAAAGLFGTACKEEADSTLISRVHTPSKIFFPPHCFFP